MIPVSYGGLLLEPERPGLSDIFAKSYHTGYWKSYRGDYSFSGWMVTFFYVLCCFILLFVFFKTSFTSGTDKTFWILIFGIILFLSINKQLDLQMLITDIARTTAKEYHLYETRKLFQIKIISFFTSLGFGAIALLIFFLRKSHKSVFVALGGITAIFLFLFFRLISFHKIEAILREHIGFFTLFDCFELVGIFLVIFSCIWYYKSHKY
jgi:hypothetical protein